MVSLLKLVNHESGSFDALAIAPVGTIEDYCFEFHDQLYYQ
ncbi:hypothetical protein [Nostoc sp.]